MARGQYKGISRWKDCQPQTFRYGISLVPYKVGNFSDIGIDNMEIRFESIV
jgi:hypothetical protein